MLTLSDTSYGDYLRVTLCNSDGKQITCRVHILVALAFIPNPDDLPQVHHIDSNGKNNHVSNLMWTTMGDNNLLKHHGSLDVVEKIKDYITAGWSTRRIALELNVSHNMVRRRKNQIKESNRLTVCYYTEEDGLCLMQLEKETDNSFYDVLVAMGFEDTPMFCFSGWVDPGIKEDIGI